MFMYASIAENIYQRIILSLKVCAAATSFVLASFGCLAVIRDFEHNTLIKIVYITCIYVMIVSIEKTLKFLHKLLKKYG